MEKPQKIIVTEEGHFYLLKRPLYKQGLFWSTLIASLIALFFLFQTLGLSFEHTNMSLALQRYGMYYDSDDQDLYYYEEFIEEADLAPVLERLSGDSLLVVDRMLQDPEEVKLQELEPAMKEIKQEAKNYAKDLETFLINMIEDGSFSEDDWIDFEDNFKTYRGLVNISADSITELYRTRDEEKRSFSEEERQLIEESLDILLNFNEALYETVEITPEASI